MVPLKRLLCLLVYAAALISLLPLLPFLEGWPGWALLAGFGLGFLRDRYGWVLLPAPLATALATLGGLSILLQMTASQVVMPLIQILCLLLAIRLSSEKSPRNMLQSFLLALLLLAASTLLTLEMAYLLYLPLMILIVSSGLVLLCFVSAGAELYLPWNQLRLLGRAFVLLPAGALIIMLGLFFLLPRTQTPLWHFLNPRPGAAVGLADRVQPGSLSQLQDSREIAFRAESTELSPGQLYWRGIVFHRYNGKSWQRGQPSRGEPVFAEDSVAAGDSLKIFSEPGEQPFLITLDGTGKISGLRHYWYTDGTVVKAGSKDKNAVYRLGTIPGRSLQARKRSPQHLSVPATVSSRIKQAARRIAEQQPDFAGRVSALQDFFSNQQLHYSADNLPLSAQPVDSFLFESKRGYCEYFASAFALMLRLMDIPSRVVGGYLGGSYNDFGGYYLVTQGQAHVWVEALDDRERWVRVDPSRLAINANESLLANSRRGKADFQQLLDSLFHVWSNTVLNFDFNRQVALLKATLSGVQQLETPSLNGLKPRLYFLLAAPVLFIALVYAGQRYRLRSLVHRYRRRVAHCAGLKTLPAGLGLYAIAEQNDNPLCQDFADICGRVLYAEASLSWGERRKLSKIIARLKGVPLAIAVAFPATLSNNAGANG